MLTAQDSQVPSLPVGWGNAPGVKALSVCQELGASPCKSPAMTHRPAWPPLPPRSLLRSPLGTMLPPCSVLGPAANHLAQAGSPKDLVCLSDRPKPQKPEILTIFFFTVIKEPSIMLGTQEVLS